MANPYSLRSVTTQFKPGQSGNPSGRPKDILRVAELARTYTEEAIIALVEVVRNPKHPQRVAAAEALLNRGWGKPLQPVDVEMEGEPLEIIVRHVNGWMPARPLLAKVEPADEGPS